MSKDYKDSSIYKQGLFYKELGELLMNPNTTVKQFSDFSFRHKNDYSIKFSMLSEQPATEYRNDYNIKFSKLTE